MTEQRPNWYPPLLRLVLTRVTIVTIVTNVTRFTTGTNVTNVTNVTNGINFVTLVYSLRRGLRDFLMVLMG